MSGAISSRLSVTMEQMEGKKKTTNPDRCKRYREKNAEEYKINDALRKNRTRLLLKSNKNAYEEQQRKEREIKRLAKHRKKFAINHSDLDQEPSQASFNSSAVKSRTIKKVVKHLPQSPRKKKEVTKI